MKNLLAGILFSILWSSAAVATKLGIQSVHPFILANFRLIVAGISLLLFSYLFSFKNRLVPNGKEIKQLALFGLLNSTLYLGAFVLAIKYISPGIGSLATATNPLFITLFSALFLQKKPSSKDLISLMLGLTGILIASFPQVHLEGEVGKGLLILIAGIMTVSLATVYYVQTSWSLNALVINGWQVFLGGIFLLPFTLYFADFDQANFDLRFFLSAAWLIFPVSILAIRLWFYMIDKDPIAASMWIFLCPVFGYLFAYFFSAEPISIFTIVGTLMVMLGLYVGKKQSSNA
ncbi:DMT family transporter [Aquirufa rosea]|uniref:EamA family transporter n=1 Tax=Aquirufa rosea TaxID=2509241 RepID=A0A4Q1BZ62_9BACT|nr:EamA family transporter [Aquirufa rosea]RXK48789.1 EamA family transporter [Aquirufa rosea]